MLWKKVMPRLSAGRVQSVATRLVVDRERERMEFVAAPYWDVDGTFEPKGRQGRRGAARRASTASALLRARDFTRRRDAGVTRGRRPRRGAGARRSRPASRVERSRSRRSTRSPTRGARRAVPHLDAPAGGQPQAPLHRAGHDAARPAALRERPHHLHAHRLDDAVDTALDGGARAGARALRRRSTCPTAPRRYEREVKNAQEAHEAIRPAGDASARPDGLRGELERDELRALRPDLEAHGRVADEGRERPDGLDQLGGRDHRRDEGDVQRERQGDHLPRASSRVQSRPRRARRESDDGAPAARRSRSARSCRASALEPQRARRRSRPPATRRRAS